MIVRRITRGVTGLVSDMRRASEMCRARYSPSPVHSSSLSLIHLPPYIPPLYPPSTDNPIVSRSTRLHTSRSSSLLRPPAFTIFPFVIGRIWPHQFFFHPPHPPILPSYSRSYVHSCTQAGPATPCGSICVRTHAISCPTVGPSLSRPIIPSVPNESSPLSHAQKPIKSPSLSPCEPS